MSVANSSVTLVGSTVTIDPSVTLADGTSYYVLVDSGAIRDLAGNAFAGFSTPTAWNFTTKATTLPDLVGRTFSVDPDHMPGAEATVSYTIDNAGAGPAGAFNVNVVLSDNNVIGDADDIVVATRSYSGLAGLGSTSDSFLLSISPSVRQTMYNWAKRDDSPSLALPHVSSSSDWLGIVIDPAHAVDETNDANNANQGKGVDKDDVTYFPWDNNSSGQITPTDAIFVINRLAQTVPPGDRRADPDGSGSVTPTDAIGVINRLGYQRNSAVNSAALPGAEAAKLAAAPAAAASATTVTVTPALRELDATPGLLVGEQFEVDFTFTDVHSTSQAVFAGYADVGFDPAMFRVDSIQYGSEYAAGHTGTIDNTDGLVNEVGATGGITPATSRVVFTLRMTAVGAGISSVFTNAGEDVMSQVVVYGLDTDQRDSTSFGSVRLSVSSAPTAHDGLAVYDPAQSTWYVRNTATAGSPDGIFGFGAPGAGWVPVYGDWNGDGRDTAGLYDPGTSIWYFTNGTTSCDVIMAFGAPGAGWRPVVGDWNGDGVDTPGMYDPKSSVWYLTNSLRTANADSIFGFGAANAGWLPVAGDWNGDGRDTVGLYDPASATWYLSDTNGSVAPSAIFGFGAPGAGWNPVSGDWNGDGRDTIGLYDPHASNWYFTNTNRAGNAETIFGFGAPNSGWRNARGSSNPATTGAAALAVDQVVRSAVAAEENQRDPLDLFPRDPSASLADTLFGGGLWDA